MKQKNPNRVINAPSQVADHVKQAKKLVKLKKVDRYKVDVFSFDYYGTKFKYCELRSPTKAKLKNQKIMFKQAMSTRIIEYGEIEPLLITDL